MPEAYLVERVPGHEDPGDRALQVTYLLRRQTRADYRCFLINIKQNYLLKKNPYIIFTHSYINRC